MGHGSEKCYKLIDRFEAEVIVSLVLIGQFKYRKCDDCIPEIICCHKAKVKVKAKVKAKARSVS